MYAHNRPSAVSIMSIPSFRSSLLLPILLLPLSATQAQTTTAAQATSVPTEQPATAQSMAPFNMADNMELIYKVLDASGKPAGELRQRVVNLRTHEREESKKRIVTESVASLKSGLYNKKKGLVRLQDLTFRSRRDTCFTDGLANLNSDALRSFRDRRFEYIPVPLAWPNQPTVGSTLPPGGVSVQISSSVVSIATVSTLLNNRRVVSGPTPITTPAGTFSCYKVEANRESATVPRPDMAMRTSVKQVDFYAPGVGIVRTEIYDKKGKLEQVLELAARNSSPQ